MNEKVYNYIGRVDKTGELAAVKEDPNKIVRYESLSDLREVYGNDVSAEQLTKTAKELFAELSEDYGITVPVDFVIDKNREDEIIVGEIVDRIEGVNLDEVEITNDVIEKTEHLYLSIAKYLFDKYESEEEYLADINSGTQYVYGKKSGGTEDQIYLIDTDVIYRKGRKGMFLVFYWFTRHVSGMERRCGRKFDGVREIVKKIVSLQVSEHTSDEEAKEIKAYKDDMKNYLDDKKFGLSPTSAIPSFENKKNN